MILNFAEKPKRGGSPPKEKRFKDKILLLKKESSVEKMLLIWEMWFRKKNKIIEKERKQ